ncbi:unnamed protein product [Acanthoscelides obtectus]|uniref:Myb-like domain-containing protein n=1 Tax=Acanthoscelides obtectus TaxID=200917 RepID=A0A9P0PAD6_ACAOB|nr:unnamed protein product [Acanthoscelides obtectus]CAK1682126.1 hypothetical protein AOBTE_LOCUS33446 [Acanthoscelides obtectus]
MSLKIELRDEEQGVTYTIGVSQEEFNEIVVNGNLTLATELLQQQQERDNFKKAFEFVHDIDDTPECSSVSTSRTQKEAIKENCVDNRIESNNSSIQRDGIGQDIQVGDLPIQETSKLWTDEATLALIDMYRKYEQRFDSGVKKYVWSKIARELTEKLGSQYNIQQCDTKWKVLKNQYKSVKKHNDQSGNSKKTGNFLMS